MKIYSKTSINDKEAAVIKDNGLLADDVDLGKAASKKAAEAASTVAIDVREENCADQNRMNRGLRHILVYERRMNRGLFCALGFIVLLCLLGMATSIGGALYLKFRASARVNDANQLYPVAASIIGNASDLKAISEDSNSIHIRVSIPMDEIPATTTTTETSVFNDPFEEAIWDELRKRNGLGDDNRSETTTQSSAGSEPQSDSEKSQEEDSSPKFISVTKHRALQEPPSFSDLFTFVRKALRIPTIKIVHDADE